MDWQVLILTLGASLITGFTSVAVNIIISRSNIKRTILENKEMNKKEYVTKRLKLYDDILFYIKVLENKLQNREDCSENLINLEACWKKNYHYCSSAVSFQMKLFFNYFDHESDMSIKIKNIREQIKQDIDDYYCINDKKSKLEA